MSDQWIDITRTLSDAIACWPGDVPFRFELGATIEQGSSCNVGSVRTSLHTGTHMDAPFHYDPAGATIERLDPSLFLGPAWLVDVSDTPETWRPQLEGLDLSLAARVIFRTGAWSLDGEFPKSIPVMEPELPDWLGERGVRLIGVDLPSVDPLDSKTLDRHHALGRNGICILEGLTLEAAHPGLHELAALPLKIQGADGSPVRALIRPLRSTDPGTRKL